MDALRQGQGSKGSSPAPIAGRSRHISVDLSEGLGLVLKYSHAILWTLKLLTQTIENRSQVSICCLYDRVR